MRNSQLLIRSGLAVAATALPVALAGPPAAALGTGISVSTSGSTVSVTTTVCNQTSSNGSWGTASLLNSSQTNFTQGRQVALSGTTSLQSAAWQGVSPGTYTVVVICTVNNTTAGTQSIIVAAPPRPPSPPPPRRPAVSWAVWAVPSGTTARSRSGWAAPWSGRGSSRPAGTCAAVRSRTGSDGGGAHTGPESGRAANSSRAWVSHCVQKVSRSMPARSTRCRSRSW